MFRISEKANPNYLAKVVQLPPLRKHSNADRLQCVSIDGNNVITDMTAKEGEYYVFFPLESAINKDFLAWSNGYEDKALNADKEKKGFFNNKGRVRAIRLRGERSEGYICPLEVFLLWISETFDPKAIHEYDLDGYKEEYFDSWHDTAKGSLNDVVLVEKYVVKHKHVQNAARNTTKKVRRSKLVDGQFKLHVDTQQFKRYTDAIKADDIISVTYKLHGTSFVVGKVLCNKPLKWWERGLKAIGVPIETVHYDTIYASRKVVKNAFEEAYDPVHFYGYDLWEDIAKTLEEALTPGITLYGEAVGYTRNGAFIQTPFDYGCRENTFETYIYRITMTNVAGRVFEFTTQQVKDYCLKNNLKYVPELYYGKAFHLSPMFGAGMPETTEILLKDLSDLYLEKDCWMCNNKVPAEGVVIRREIFDIEAYKFKSFKFLEFETKQLDSGEAGLEEE